MPIVLPVPPRDGKLGRSYDNAATSCADIRRWGDEHARSGEYWINLASKGKQMVFCDMETDGGGWTLFYNYKHYPGQDITLDSTVYLIAHFRNFLRI